MGKSADQRTVLPPGMCVKAPSGEAPCHQACPAGIDVPGYIRFIALGEPEAALSVIRASIPFPSVCGYVCFHPCEAKCRLGVTSGSPVAINALKRFAAEKAVPAKAHAPAAGTGKHVAIVGSGPAGLTAAYYLALLGHRVTVFESLPAPGGMMRYGIPPYRLPREILDSEIKLIRDLGVQIKTGTRIENLDSLPGPTPDAVFLAVGAHRPVAPGIGERTPGVLDCVSFLREVNMGRKPAIGKRLAVIGGGNAAIDSARSALRLGAREVTILYRRSRAEMPASPEDVEDALQEGIRITYLTAPKSIRNGKALDLECQRMSLGKTDSSGRARPRPVPGSEFTLTFDNIIYAIGQEPDIPATFSLTAGEGNTLKINRRTLMTARRGVFAGGDAVSGPASVIEAIAAGRQAAASIDRYLGGKGLPARPAQPKAMPVRLDAPYPIYTAGRPRIDTIPMPERVSGFAMVEKTLSEEKASLEARRCLRCGQPMLVNPAECRACLMCQLVCSLSHEKVMDPARSYIRIVRTIKPGGELDISISFTDKCDSCGLCSRYCVYGALLAGGFGITNELAKVTTQ